jgi:hypothetical protein
MFWSRISRATLATEACCSTVTGARVMTSRTCWAMTNRWWRAWTDTDPPSELQALIDAVTTGHCIDLYRRI